MVRAFWIGMTAVALGACNPSDANEREDGDAGSNGPPEIEGDGDGDGDDTSDEDPEGEAPGGEEPDSEDSIDLVINTARYLPEIGAATPGPENRFVVLALTLSNLSVQTPVSTSVAYFMLQTGNALALLPSPAATGYLTDSCRSDLAVLAGGQASCELAFELASDQVPSELVYDDGQGHRADAPVPEIDSTSLTCDPLAGFSFGSEACSECIIVNCPNSLSEEDLSILCEADNACIQANCADRGCSCVEECLVTPECRFFYERTIRCISEKCSAPCK